ncbi:50S ribosomal protein L11 methyltransferase [Owenweeksia hongkongensis]|uniref:50S ribosomal protein L11 methyltransferase n=1 Tax=Owenweeksia hongkongensis TaxID=253245 RepID=UPI003A9579E2
MKEYLEIDFTITPAEGGRDILLALLDNLGYDSFEETPKGLKAYILEKYFNAEEIESLFIFHSDEYEVSYATDKLENKNWNEEWETNYQPIFIDDKIHIRAPFHEAHPEYPIELLITPKMSFGTGHHQTTRLVSRLMLDMDLEGKKILDMGTGTGVLAVLAEKRGAGEIDAIDNFEWAAENTEENAEANNCKNITAIHGDAEMLPGRKYDIVLANINRNVLMEDMKTYIDTLPTGGYLVISGFFENDFEMLTAKATECGTALVNKIKEDRWMACQYQKQ